MRHVGFLDGAEIRYCLNKGLELMIEKRKEYGRIAWLVDLREGDAVAEADLQWIAADWNARLLEAGICYVAFVLSEDDYAFSSVSAESYQGFSEEEVGDQVINRNFQNEESAKAWLREVLSN
ncbi:hypothetical protein GCM10009122_60170 [Fulvivirga kasyanovii]